MRDALFDQLEETSAKEIKNKADDTLHASQATMASASLTAMALYFESPVLFTTILAVLTLLLTSCWRNEKKRLEILKTLPIKNSDAGRLKALPINNNAQESSESSTPSSPNFLLRRPCRAASAPSPSPKKIIRRTP